MEHRTATLQRLGDAAVELFASKGPDATFDEIARRAGLSRRTVFRYVSNKEELAYIQPLLWLDVFDEAIRESAHLPLPDRLRRASGAIAHYIDADPERPRAAFTVTALHPELGRGFSGIFQRWVDRVAAETLADIEVPGADDRFRARIVGAAVMGMVDAVTREWVAAPPSTRFTDLYERGFDILAPILGEFRPSGAQDAKLIRPRTR